MDKRIPSKKFKTLETHQNDIEFYIKSRGGKVLDSKWRFIGKDNRKIPFFLIGCDKDCDYNCDERRKFWINKYELKPSNRYPTGKWCPYSKINMAFGSGVPGAGDGWRWWRLEPA